ncbi:transglutaminase-like cysteine peptidase [Pseudomonas benzenivorans]|uniref:Transglutaminase-like cysteine peptidase n=1 Tax=Pseudomonas benzenivorans TaxID=556533 RepID=A0ABZ0PQY1_9PSED|nr:transglutaminase-like cysteine peptidase [Pseudomonas benzenivorans]WPC03563.1 transglutaminase-like cysteine peptidase [Pseudomonas benzenivorans]
MLLRQLLKTRCTGALCRAVALTTLGTSVLLGAAEAKASWSFDQIMRKVEKRYGRQGPAKDRLLSWNQLIESSRYLSERDKLEAVNQYFNRELHFRSDAVLWKQSDYWATPIETLVQGAGDCEDFSLAKYFTLRKLGVPEERLRITYAREMTRDQAHMVLSYYAAPGAEPLILDNLDSAMLPASQRQDLVLLYAFDAHGLYQIKDGRLQRTGDTARLPGWQALMARMRQEGFSLDQG